MAWFTKALKVPNSFLKGMHIFTVNTFIFANKTTDTPSMCLYLFIWGPLVLGLYGIRHKNHLYINPKKNLSSAILCNDIIACLRFALSKYTYFGTKFEHTCCGVLQCHKISNCDLSKEQSKARTLGKVLSHPKISTKI